MKWVAVATFSGRIGVVRVARARSDCNPQTDGRDYEALAYLPKDTLVALTYFREVSTSDKSSLSQSQGIFVRRTSLKFGNLSIVPFDVLLPVVDVSVYVPALSMNMVPGLSGTLHTSGLADATYLPTIGYTITENETSHTVIAATGYITAPTGRYDATRIVNIGDNRWRIQPQIAVSQRFLKAMTVDLVGSAAFYTKNSDFSAVPGQTMSQGSDVRLRSARNGRPFERHVRRTFVLSAGHRGERRRHARDASRRRTLPDAPDDTLCDRRAPVEFADEARIASRKKKKKKTHLLLQYNQDIEEWGGGAYRSAGSSARD